MTWKKRLRRWLAGWDVLADEYWEGVRTAEASTVRQVGASQGGLAMTFRERCACGAEFEADDDTERYDGRAPIDAYDAIEKWRDRHEKVCSNVKHYQPSNPTGDHWEKCGCADCWRARYGSYTDSECVPSVPQT